MAKIDNIIKRKMAKYGAIDKETRSFEFITTLFADDTIRALPWHCYDSGATGDFDVGAALFPIVGIQTQQTHLGTEIDLCIYNGDANECLILDIMPVMVWAEHEANYPTPDLTSLAATSTLGSTGTNLKLYGIDEAKKSKHGKRERICLSPLQTWSKKYKLSVPKSMQMGVKSHHNCCMLLIENVFGGDTNATMFVDMWTSVNNAKKAIT